MELPIRSQAGTLARDLRTFRVRGVPHSWDPDRLESFLTDHENSTGMTIRSLASEIDGRTKTATVTFQNLLPPLRDLRAGETRSFRLPKKNENLPGRYEYLTLDHGFFGISTLYAPPPEDRKVDVIAVSGLGGYAFGSFKEKGGDYMWLRDSLPYDLTLQDTNIPMARTMIYGYESKVSESTNMQNLEDLATAFHTSLLALASKPTMRPIIFVAHSLGGLIIKQTLISLSKSTVEDDINLLRAVRGIAFFGVPNDGMDISSLIPMAGDGPNRFLLESINRINSQILTMQQREFYKALGEEGEAEIICFYETVESPTAQKDEHGNWKMNGPPKVLVTKSSATVCRPWENRPEYICAIARTHSLMVKFGPQDHEYEKACERLKGLTRRALSSRNRFQRSTANFLVPYNQNEDFVGRSEILRDLEERLSIGQPQRAVKLRSRISLYGLGGVGKTQIAIAYVYWLRQTHPGISVFWVHGGNAERFRGGYSSIAQELNIPGRDDPQIDVLSLVKTWLEKNYQQRWLMVIDNADDIELFVGSQEGSDEITPSNSTVNKGASLGRYVPECAHGSILVTTRNKQVGLKLAQGKPPIEVDKLTDAEATMLMRALMDDQEVNIGETTVLASRLEKLPLALAQAAAFIQGNSITIGEYIKLLDDSDVALVDRLSEPFNTVGRDSETPRSLTATWIILFEMIEQQDSFTSNILSFISLLDRQAIPKEFITIYCFNAQPQGLNAIDAAKLTKSLGLLKAFSFITNEKNETVDMHRLVQLVTRKWLLVKGAMVGFAQHALKTVADAYPKRPFGSRLLCLKYLPHANSVLSQDGTRANGASTARARLLGSMVHYLSQEGYVKEAEQHQTQAIALLEVSKGEEHPTTCTTNTVWLVYLITKADGRSVKS
ncbi:Protein SERAC1 [Ilyonectria robusta]